MVKTTIQIEKETREMLRSAGRKGETYDEIIRELVELREAFIRDLYRILEETSEDEWISLEDFIDAGGFE